MASDVNLDDFVNNEIIKQDNLYTPFWNFHSKIISSILPLSNKLTINTENNIYKIWQLNNFKQHSDIFNQSIPEYLFYSNLGRADLIHFGIWLNNFRDKNGTDFSKFD